jgi:hypothetical protein
MGTQSFAARSLVATRTLLAAAACMGSLSLSSWVLAADPVPSLNAGDLAQGRYAAAQMLLEKTFLKVDVLTVDMRFSKATQTKFAEIAGGKPYSKELDQPLAQAAIGAGRAVVRLKFKRNVELGQWMDVVKENMGQAVKAGLFSSAVEKKVGGSLPTRFAALKERGFHENDSIFYDLYPDSLRTVVVGADGAVLLDQVSKDADVIRVVLSSYFAPGSEFREPLLKSLLK